MRIRGVIKITAKYEFTFKWLNNMRFGHVDIYKGY